MRWTLLATLLLCGLIGCGDRRDREVYVHRTGPAAHVCTRDCHQHYYDNNRLVVIRNHRHGPDCGHGWVDNRWVVVRNQARVVHPARKADVRVQRAPARKADVRVRQAPARKADVRVRQGHVCTRACNMHYHDGNRLIVLRDHRHGSNCGHRWDGHHWVSGARGKVRRP